MIRFIAALDNKLGIADDDGIPWDLPTDRQFFRDQTSVGLILMGYSTYEEFTKPMHGPINFVATRIKRQLKPGFEVVNDVETFFKEHADERINNIGGAGLFASTLQFADELILTRIDGDFHCTKFFPQFENDFEKTSQSKPITENGTTFHFETWEPKKKN